jgi:P2 family phage contractile tail tube protein
MAQDIKRITNANIYMNGNSLLGRAEEVQAPVIKHKFTEHKALGLIGTPEFFSGIEKMEAKIKWNSFYPDVLKLVANPITPIQLQVRASLETYGSSGRTGEDAVVCYMTATPKDFPTGSFKQHDNVELETNFAITYCKLEIGGLPILEIDVLASIYKVNGLDILSQYRANLGI